MAFLSKTRLTSMKFPFPPKYSKTSQVPLQTNKIFTAWEAAAVNPDSEEISDLYLVKQFQKELPYDMRKESTAMVLKRKFSFRQIAKPMSVPFQKELDALLLLSSLGHENILEFIESIDLDKLTCFIVLDYYPGSMTMADMLADTKVSFTEQDAQVYFFEAAKALKFCHDNKIIHRNIRPESFLMVPALDADAPTKGTSRFRVLKLMDFSQSILSLNDEDPMSDELCGGLYYVSPQMADGEFYDYKTDFWSLGVCLYQFISGGYFPVTFTSKSEMHTVVGKTIILFDWASDFSDEVKDFMFNLLMTVPEARMGGLDCLRHPWLIDLMKQDEKNAALEAAKLKLTNLSQESSIGLFSKEGVLARSSSIRPQPLGRYLPSARASKSRIQKAPIEHFTKSKRHIEKLERENDEDLEGEEYLNGADLALSFRNDV